MLTAFAVNGLQKTDRVGVRESKETNDKNIFNAKMLNYKNTHSRYGHKIMKLNFK